MCTMRHSQMEQSFMDEIHLPDHVGTTWNISASTRLVDRHGARLSGSFAPKSRLWRKNNGVPIVWISIGNSTHLDLHSVKKATDLWTDQTDGCIQFVKMEQGECMKAAGLDHGVIHVNTFDSNCCSAYFGYQFGHEGGDKKCQQLCIDKRACSSLQINNLVSRSLGLLSPMNRPDRDDYITFHPENMDIDMWPPIPFNDVSKWVEMQKCPPTAVGMAVPVPYDFLSTMHPFTSQYAGSWGDPKAVVVTRDITKQYLLDHKLPACPDLSHFDVYQTHKAYGCDKIFEKECNDNNGPPPKCQNYGYLKKDCTCVCAKHFNGTRCETKTDEPDFCFGNVWFLNVTEPGLYHTSELGMHILDRPNMSDSRYQFNSGNYYYVQFLQFLTVTVQLAASGKHVSVALNHTAAQTVIDKMKTTLDFFLKNLHDRECQTYQGGSVLFWGASRSKHVRTWCFSSLYLNEPSPIVLRSRVPRTFDLVFHSSLGRLTNESQLCIDALQFQLEVTTFDVMKSTYQEPVANGTAGNGKRPGGVHSGGLAEALLAPGAGGIIVTLLVGFLLLAVIGGVAAWFWYRGDDEDDDLSSEDSSDELEDAETPPPEPEEKAEDGEAATVEE